jgi:hypothetical protein
MRLVGRQQLLGKSKGIFADNRRHRDLDPFRSWPLVVRAIALGHAATMRSGRVTRWRGLISVLPKQAVPPSSSAPASELITPPSKVPTTARPAAVPKSNES